VKVGAVALSALPPPDPYFRLRFRDSTSNLLSVDLRCGHPFGTDAWNRSVGVDDYLPLTESVPVNAPVGVSTI
jgi:hypothetical protein